MWCSIGVCAALGACHLPPDGDEAIADPSTPDSPPGSQGDVMRGFSWVVDQQLAAMPRPGRTGDLDTDLAFLASHDLTLLISLTVDPLGPEQVAAHGMTPLHIPVHDFTAPTLEQFHQFLDEALPRMERGERVGVHCTAGQGRTGTLMAGYFVSQGMTPDAAIAEIRRLRPGSIETESQEHAIAALASVLRGHALEHDLPVDHNALD